MMLWSKAGNSQRLDGGAMFGSAPQALWRRWREPDAENRIPLACRSLLVEDLDGRNVPFETGIGAFFEPRLRERYGVVEAGHVLLDSLAEAGFTHEDIDVVVLSHLHFDHAGRTPRCLGERAIATAVVPGGGVSRLRNPLAARRESAPSRPGVVHSRLDGIAGSLAAAGTRRRRPFADTRSGCALPLQRRACSRTDAAELVTGGSAPGIVFCADLIPGRPWVHVPVTMGYDRFPERLIEEKRAVLGDQFERDVRLFFTHDPDCATARVARDASGRFATFDESPMLAGEEA